MEQTNPKSQEMFLCQQKGSISPSYDEVFKAYDVKMVTSQGLPPKKVAAELSN